MCCEPLQWSPGDLWKYRVWQSLNASTFDAEFDVRVLILKSYCRTHVSLPQ